MCRNIGGARNDFLPTKLSTLRETYHHPVPPTNRIDRVHDSGIVSQKSRDRDGEDGIGPGGAILIVMRNLKHGFNDVLRNVLKMLFDKLEKQIGNYKYVKKHRKINT